MNKMNSQFAFDTHQLMERTSVKLSFSGEFSSELITVLLLMAKRNIGGRSVMKKVYNIMIEGLENLTKHALKSEGDKFPAIFVLAQDDDFYYLATGNKIMKNEVSLLQEKLEKVNSLNKDEVREWYNEILMSDNGVNAKGGAGLGIIDMALKSGNDFAFSFQDIDAEHSFFTLKIKVDDDE